MTQEFKDMLHLLGAAINGCKIDTDREYDVEKIRKLALSQGVWTILFQELEKVADTSKYNREFSSALVWGIQKNISQTQILQELNENGIKCCLLKGASVAALYPIPEHRISGDTDILIPPEGEKYVSEQLKKKGYTVYVRDRNDHHFKADHPVVGLMEVHVSLYSATTEKILLGGLDFYNEEYSNLEIEGVSIPVLGINDGLMYLTAHYIKHLMNDGGGVRQMIDLLLYIERYKDKIDFERYDSILKQLRYDKLIMAVKTIGAKYWGFDYPLIHEELADQILSESELSGIFGSDNNNLKGFYLKFCDIRTKNSIKGKMIIAFKAERNIFDKLFPKKNMLIAMGYSYAKHTILVPVATVHHIIDAILKKRNKNNIGNQNYIEQKLSLMRKLDVID